MCTGEKTWGDVTAKVREERTGQRHLSLPPHTGLRLCCLTGMKYPGFLELFTFSLLLALLCSLQFYFYLRPKCFLKPLLVLFSSKDMLPS